MNYNHYKYNSNSKRYYNNYKTQSNFKPHGNYVSNNAHDNDQHPKHPVRNVFFCIYCFFFSISFSYLWVWKMFEFEYTWLTILIAALIIVGAVIGGIVSFKNSHSNYFAHRRNRKNRYYR